MLIRRAEQTSGKPMAMDGAAGDVVYIQPNTTHQFTNAGNEPFKFLCLVPVTFDCGTPTPGS